MLLVIAGARGTTAHDPTTNVTFACEVRAILAARCLVCHSPGGSAPMPLTTYEETRPWARAIKEQVLARRMPKWHAARGVGAFANDPSLTPFERDLLVTWIDGGLPRGVDASETSGAPPAMRPGVPRRLQSDIIAMVPAGSSEGTGTGESRWITGWSFEPGDPLITSAMISSAAGPIGTWTAGDRDLRFPPGSAMRIARAVRVEVRRRTAADYEHPFDPRPSVLRLRTPAAMPVRRVWVEQVSCGAPRSGRTGELIAVRPMVPDGGSARLWVERAGAPATMIGWFRDVDTRYARTYWLARPADFAVDARLQGDGRPCEAQITLSAALPQQAVRTPQ